MPPLVRSQILSDLSLIEGNALRLPIQSSNLLPLFTAMTPPKCNYTRPYEEGSSPSIRIYWTRQHQRLSLYINQEGTIQIFKYRNDLGRDIGFMFPGTNSLGTHDFAD